jgi:hypothetical protein
MDNLRYIQNFGRKIDCMFVVELGKEPPDYVSLSGFAL